VRVEVLLACSPAPTTPVERAGLAALANAVRREAPDLDVRQVVVSGPLADALPVLDVPAVAVPIGLSPQRDVVRALAAARAQAPRLRLAAPLGPDWALAELGVERLIAAGARKADTLVLGVPGSTDGQELAAFARAARLLSAVWGGRVHLGSLSGSDTSLPDAIDIARAYGRRVVVSSYLLSGGRQLGALRASGADLVTAPFLDGGPPDPRLAGLVLTRFEQALGRAALASDPGA
jgi:hypothetical protein